MMVLNDFLFIYSNCQINCFRASENFLAPLFLSLDIPFFEDGTTFTATIAESFVVGVELVNTQQ